MRGVWLLVLYIPVSSIVIGLMSNFLRLAIPAIGRRGFAETFWAYALRFPGDFSPLRWVAPALGWVLLLLMLAAVRTRKPILPLFEIRVILLVLIVLFTLLAKIFTVLAPIAETKDLVVQLLLFMDVDLVLVFLASYLRIFKPLKRRLV